jgi:flagellar biogenesis protein FliO
MPGSSQTVTTVLGSLGAVLGLFFVAAWFWRRHMPKSMSQLPGEVLEQLGRATLSGKQQMHLVRVGQKLVLLAVTPVGVETLTEITDPEEVDRLCGLCRQSSSHGPSAEFRAVLRHFEREPARGFLGIDPRPRGGVHAQA